MATKNLVNPGSGDGLLPVGTKPIPELLSIYLQFCDIHRIATPQELLMKTIRSMFSDIWHLQLLRT